MVYLLNYFNDQNAPDPLPPARPRQRRRSIPLGEGIQGLQLPLDESAITKSSKKIMKFIQKTVTSFSKLSEHPLAKHTTSQIKKWGDRVAGIFTFSDIFSGKIELSGLKKVMSKIVSGELPNDEELGMILSVIALDEVLGKECDVSVQKRIFDALKIPFHSHIDIYRNWMQMRRFMRANIDEMTKGLTALGMGNKFEKMVGALRVLSDTQKTSKEREEALINAIEAGTGIGLFCTSLGTCGLSSMAAGIITAGLAVTGGVMSALSSFWPDTLNPLEQLQREIKKLIEADFKMLDKENSRQFKAGFRLSQASHFYDKQFESFHQNVNLVCRDIAQSLNQQNALQALDRYIALRTELQMPQPKQVYESGEKLKESGEKLKDWATALQIELTDLE